MANQSNSNSFNVLKIASYFLVTLIGILIGYKQNNENLKLKYVEMSISILKNKPHPEESKEIRKWAISILNYYSKIKLSDSAKLELQSNQIYKTLFTCPDGWNVYEKDISECPDYDSIKNIKK